MSPAAKRQTLRLLSFNIQVGINSRRYADYITSSWQHILPNSKRMETLHAMSRLMKDYDIVALQEADGGSIRSNFINQVSLLAQFAGFSYWHQQCNRNLGRIAQHSNGLLSKVELERVTNHKLPGIIPGRGAIEAHLGNAANSLQIIVAHLALSSRVRRQQLSYIADLIRNQPYVILMGDFNCTYDEVLSAFASLGVELHQPRQSKSATYPSWKPVRHYDHILVSPEVCIESYATLPNTLSDHLPVALEISLPEQISHTTVITHKAHPVKMHKRNH